MTRVRRRAVLAACAALALLVAVPALAFWTSAAALGSGASAGGTIPAGVQPTVAVAGTTVTPTWVQTSIPVLGRIGSLAGGGYDVRRYADGSATAITPGATCNVLISGAGASLSCAEAAVSEGRWRYTVTPRLNNWLGAESPLSAIALVDRTPPTTTATLAPAPNAAGWANAIETITLTAVDNAGGSGVASITYSAAGAQTIASTTYAAPFAISVDGTTTVSFRAIDNAGNAEATKTQIVRVDRTAPTGSITAPTAGAIVRGVTTVSSNSADATSGVASVTFEAAPSGTSTWAAIGTDTTSPYGFALDTTTLADGRWDLRVVTRDVAGNTFGSAAVTVVVDNQTPRGIDIQGANGGVLGEIDAGDSLVYTFSEPMLPSSILTGWTGAATAVTVRIQNGGGAGDRLTVTGSNLGTVRLGSRNWVDGTVTLAGTLTLTSANTVRLVLGACATGCIRVNDSLGSLTFTWTPNNGATDLAGNAVSTATVTETGGPKPNF